MRKLFFLLSLLFSLAPAARAEAPKAQANLISEVKTLKPGERAWVGLHLSLTPGWHVYWKNPGDTGKPPKVEWRATSGVTIHPIEWPLPKRFFVGSVVNYGYDGEVLLPFQVEVKPGFTGKVRLSGEASWLICQEECIPETQTVSLEIPVANQPAVADKGYAQAFDTAKSSIPRKLQAGEVYVGYYGGNYHIRIPRSLFGARKAETLSFFPDEQDWVNAMEPQSFVWEGTDYVLMVPALEDYPVPEHLSGVLAAGFSGGEHLSVSLAEPVALEKEPGVYWYFLFAFVGGLILNLMPCVFPVLGIKILSLLKSADDPRILRKHAYLYTLGVLVSFWVIGGTLLVVQSLGREVGWGFQLQQPAFVAFLALLFFVMALNLLSFFELGGRWMGVGQVLTQKEGAWGSFFTGALAVVVATPCSAPFMGTAVGVALLHPGFSTLLIFTSLGLGLAAPYLVVSLVPHFARFFPQPGAWMDRLKEFLSIPLLATVVWLVWVLKAQVNTPWVASLIVFFAVILLAFLVSGKKLSKVTIVIFASFFAASAGAGFMMRGHSSAVATAHELQWTVFSDEALAKARGGKRPVLIEFTADWCITCKVNESLVLNSSAFATLVKEQNIALIRADWTNEDPEITRVLRRHGRAGVPLYVLYPTDGESIVLPQVLTVDAVREALMR